MLKPLGFAFAAFAALGVAQASADGIGSRGGALENPGAVQLAQGGGADIRHAFEERRKERERARAERERQKRLGAERKARDAARQQDQPGTQ